MYFITYKDQNNQWRWTLYAANHHKLANSGEGYFNKADMLTAISLVESTNAMTPVHERNQTT